MRIIDKNQDFYDYLQDPTDNRIVFDRRNSFLLTKEMVCREITYLRDRNYSRDNDYRFLLLQCGSTFWLFLLTITERETGLWLTIHDPVDYKLELLDSWKNYDKERKLISFKVIAFSYYYGFLTRYHDEKGESIYDRVMSSVDKLHYAVDHNEFNVVGKLDNYQVNKPYKNTWIVEIRDIPLLKACGIADFIDPQIMFCAIEEYFSMEKTAAETTEPKGATNDDKIIMHGFDTKTSFRGKRKKA